MTTKDHRRPQDFGCEQHDRKRWRPSAVAALSLGALFLFLNSAPTSAFVIKCRPRRSILQKENALLLCGFTLESISSSRCLGVRGGRRKAQGVLPAISQGEDGAEKSREGKKAASGGKKASGPKSKRGASSSKSSPPPMPSSATSSSADSGKPSAAPQKVQKGKRKVKEQVPAPFFDEALLDGSRARDVYTGEQKFNLMGQSEDVIAPWSVDGFEIDLPDWRPQPAQRYRIVDPAVMEQLGKIENMFGASLRLVSTEDGIWRFLYSGNVRNLIGAEAWTKLLLIEDLKIAGVREVRFETNYVRDWPDDHN
ncbi:hypothetical protein Naga_100043g3 [Nannochloropsis gaditana]|uniref:Uncharacterized protein n=1 Tax=Nannochloropsis gaditana TaxID=72520 RepID=W7TRK4_9STRA|nr:hypothetical protein Naga_100043g3 [Nannochloropsis gaditana]